MVLIVVLGMLSAFEYAKMACKKKFSLHVKLIQGMSAFALLSFFWSAQRGLGALLPLFLLFLYMSILFIEHFQKKESSIAEIAIGLFPFIYIVIPLGLSFYILYQFPHGRWWVAYLIVVTKVADIGGYFGGKLLGKHKLASTISPNKTWEGTLSALGSALVVTYLFYYFYSSNLSFSLPIAMGLGLMLGLIGQVGDLCESLLKRDAKVKDSNNIPGIGGILDLVDSILLNIPVLFFFLLWVS